MNWQSPEVLLYIAAAGGTLSFASSLLGLLEKLIPFLISFCKKNFSYKKYHCNKVVNTESEPFIQKELIALFTIFLSLIKSGSIELDGLKKNLKF
jgi:hypothetical protein